MKKTRILISTLIVAGSLIANIANAGLKIKQQDKSYPFDKIESIVTEPYTSNGVDLGKVSPDRLPKINAILDNSKKQLYSDMTTVQQVPGARVFYKSLPNKKPTTVILKINFDQFDNGNAVARSILLFGGSAKVTLTASLYDAANDNLILQMTSTDKDKGSEIIPGSLDADALTDATFNAHNAILLKLRKIGDFKERGLNDEWNYMFRNIIKGFMKGAKTNLKEESREVK